MGEAKRKKARLAEMAEIQKEFEAVPKQIPTCPKCGADITEFGRAMITLDGNLNCIMLWCHKDECRALFALQVLGTAKQHQRPLILPSRLDFNPTRKM
jgi:Zn-finger nucleic acid-binding protein